MKQFLLFLLTVALIHCVKDDVESAGTDMCTVQHVDLLDKIVRTGVVEPSIKVELMSEASGRIKKIFVKEGQAIRKGDPILSIDPDRLKFHRDRLSLEARKAAIELEKKKEGLPSCRKTAGFGSSLRR